LGGRVWVYGKNSTGSTLSAGQIAVSSSGAMTTGNGFAIDKDVPTGYHYEIGGDYKKLVKSEKEFLSAFIIMVILVYIVLACFFESYTQPVLMLLTIPLATAGSIPVLWITRTSVNMGVYIGLLMLGGTVVSNAIILIDRLNEVKAKRGLLRSVMKVGLERSRPVLMTSLCTIVAMVPLLFETGESSDLWTPLALTVVSGLSIASVLTLFVIPAAYVVLEDLKKKKY
jgi:HAE1 family hydrophobic/amphiphilic exporter-1